MFGSFAVTIVMLHVDVNIHGIPIHVSLEAVSYRGFCTWNRQVRSNSLEASSKERKLMLPTDPLRRNGNESTDCARFVKLRARAYYP